MQTVKAEAHIVRVWFCHVIFTQELKKESVDFGNETCQCEKHESSQLDFGLTSVPLIYTYAVYIH